MAARPRKAVKSASGRHVPQKPDWVPLHVAVWLVIAELNSIWYEQIRTKGTECLPCHHCPTCCSACDAVAFLIRNFDLDDAIRRYAGTGWPWQDEHGNPRWSELTAVWASPCPEA